MTNQLKHPDRIYPHAYIVGQWMVTGPEFEDGSGWSLCIHEDSKCQRCVATFSDQKDADHAARLHGQEDRRVSVQGVLRYLYTTNSPATLPPKCEPIRIPAPPPGCDHGQTIIQNIPEVTKYNWRADGNLPPGTIEFWQDGRLAGKIVGIGQPTKDENPPVSDGQDQ